MTFAFLQMTISLTGLANGWGFWLAISRAQYLLLSQKILKTIFKQSKKMFILLFNSIPILTKTQVQVQAMWKDFYKVEDEWRGKLGTSETEVVCLRLHCQQVEEQMR